MTVKPQPSCRRAGWAEASLRIPALTATLAGPITLPHGLAVWCWSSVPRGTPSPGPSLSAGNLPFSVRSIGKNPS